MRMRAAAIVLVASCWCTCALEWSARERGSSGVKVGTAAPIKTNTTIGRGKGFMVGSARAQRTTTPQPPPPYAPFPPYQFTPTDAAVDKQDVYEEQTVSFHFVLFDILVFFLGLNELEGRGNDGGMFWVCRKIFTVGIVSQMLFLCMVFIWTNCPKMMNK